MPQLAPGWEIEDPRDAVCADGEHEAAVGIHVQRDHRMPGLDHSSEMGDLEAAAEGALGLRRGIDSGSFEREEHCELRIDLAERECAGDELPPLGHAGLLLRFATLLEREHR